jgi:hypothetical protein
LSCAWSSMAASTHPICPHAVPRGLSMGTGHSPPTLAYQ